MDIETGKYHFYRINTTTNETIEYDFEHTWLRECLKEAKNKAKNFFIKITSFYIDKLILAPF